jgi:hypothetical protein
MVDMSMHKRRGRLLRLYLKALFYMSVDDPVLQAIEKEANNHPRISQAGSS